MHITLSACMQVYKLPIEMLLRICVLKNHTWIAICIHRYVYLAILTMHVDMHLVFWIRELSDNNYCISRNIGESNI